MKKYMWWSLVFLAISCFVTIHHEQNAHDPNAVNGEWQSYSITPPYAPQADGNKEQPNRDSPSWDLAFLVFGWPNGVTVWALFITMIAIAEQSHFTRVAAQATRDASDSALKQVDHMIASERAWIRFVPGLLSPQLYPSWEQGTPTPTNPEFLKMVFHHLSLFMENVGKTPAQIDEVGCRYILIDSMDELPDEPDYGPLQPQQGRWILPGDKHHIIVDLETNGGIIYERQMEAIRSRRAFLFAYGILKYRDVSEKPRITKFGFVYYFPTAGVRAADGSEIIPRFRMEGPTAYNGST